MRKWISTFLCFCLLLLVPCSAFAESQFELDATYDSKASYDWSNNGLELWLWLSSYRGDYRISDRGSGTFKVTHALDFVAAICGSPSYSSGCSLLQTSQDANGYLVTFSEIQSAYPSGYYVLFGTMKEQQPLPTVSISPDSGEFADFLDVVVSGSSGAALYYSLDGSEPSIPYTGTIRITESTTVRAKAVNSVGSSPVVSKTYTKKVVALSLIISPDTSVLDKPLQVSLIPSESGGTVYYSLDGSEPSVAYMGPLTIDRPLTLKAKFVKNGRSSPVYQKVYKKPPIMHTDEKFFQVPVDMPAIVTGATDYISVASPGVWLFAVTFLGLLILGIIKRVFKK